MKEKLSKTKRIDARNKSKRPYKARIFTEKYKKVTNDKKVEEKVKRRTISEERIK